ncbi:ribulose bisphosphate carboxylase small subunit [Rubrivivax benzoatilyticus]|uniref:Ribulose bisphosphate carboxylase small subunit n=1 Tax=Rubrivivax benzoatilyticus TaxID=316997 RepID=A0ABX0HQ12_9BURK|nr:ribulose bisphosphate carboxylase small subunit [Rubrivivax benzoatilyticus]EGJ08745.1 ribulose bisphosphate carboxylase small subunit [Rubrivivax benzoatilyticus JA2 = ATCC BAA-35]NHK97162.1 ribulose bisphosphate carboxylase small subunit [Rubrivivax benzoatilyticus]NHL23143.1 ribulose bisphosphate carboxylase small subunit [Rubrivivax benzoatilyticus]
MSTVQDYASRLSDPGSRKMGTFSYLPPMSPQQIRKQIDWIVQNGWNPAIEHVEPQHAMHSYWYMWKLPMFGETDIDLVLAELEACHRANPGNHVRLIGYDNFSQSQGANMVIYRGRAV